MTRTKITRALLSVYDKTGVVEFARELHERGVELVSSGGTAKAIADADIPVTAVDDITGVPPILDHRVVTLHPKIHGGILADRSKPSHDADMSTYGIEPFDLVVSNLYPFAQDPGIETIDVGGPAMVRAAAKNHAFVTIVTDASQYAPLLEEMDANDNTVGDDTRRAFAVAAFASTAAFDAQIVAWLQQDELLPDATLPKYIDLALERTGEALRYGENPHQHGARYRISGTTSWWDHVEQHAGLALSYLNLYDADAAWKLVHDLGRGPAVAIIKHANPCGVALDDDLATAYQRALECDERSAFGGIVALNRPVDAATAERMVAGPQADLIMAPSWEPGTIDALIAKRKNTRLLSAGPPEGQSLDFRQISGGFLVQDAHHFAATRDDWRVVTKRAPTESEWRDAELAWRICGHVKSNAIVLVKDGQAVGIGAGQQNRVESGEIAAKKAAGRAAGGACASDAFYPFPDGIEAAGAAGVAVVVQPGGSIGDQKGIERADELGLAMVFTGERHFLH
jgi:phosphoribosylaminoimidazolecarboxamide formyltransferase/IMP cyclohydrolase